MVCMLRFHVVYCSHEQQVTFRILIFLHLLKTRYHLWPHVPQRVKSSWLPSSLLCGSRTLYRFSVNFWSVCFFNFHPGLPPTSKFHSALTSMEESIILMNCKVSRMVPLSITEKENITSNRTFASWLSWLLLHSHLEHLNLANVHAFQGLYSLLRQEAALELVWNSWE